MILTHTDVILAANAGPSFSTHTFVAIDFIPTLCAVQTRIGCAVIDISLAERSGVALAAMAEEHIIKIHAVIGADLVARIAETFVDLRLAIQASETGCAFAYESFQLIYACSAVLARFRCAVVDIMLAILARVTGFAGTRVVVDLIEALAIILTRCRFAFVYVDLARRAGPSWMTKAFMPEKIIHANAIQARIARTQIDFLVTSFAGESGRTIAVKVGDVICAIGSEQTRLLGAIVGVDFAALTFPA